MVKNIVGLVRNNHDTSIDEISKWLKDNEGDIKKLIVMYEDENRMVHSKVINMKNKDFAYFLLQELFELIGNKGE